MSGLLLGRLCTHSLLRLRLSFLLLLLLLLRWQQTRRLQPLRLRYCRVGPQQWLSPSRNKLATCQHRRLARWYTLFWVGTCRHMWHFGRGACFHFGEGRRQWPLALLLPLLLTPSSFLQASPLHDRSPLLLHPLPWPWPRLRHNPHGWFCIGQARHYQKLCCGHGLQQDQGLRGYSAALGRLQ